MEIPKKIENLLQKRIKAAEMFTQADVELEKWLAKNGIAVDADDISSGACSLFEPYSSAESIREKIKEK